MADGVQRHEQMAARGAKGGQWIPGPHVEVQQAAIVHPQNN